MGILPVLFIFARGLISNNSEDMSPLDICLPIQAIPYFPSIIKLLLKIKLWKLGVFGIWQLQVEVGEAIEDFGYILRCLGDFRHYREIGEVRSRY